MINFFSFLITQLKGAFCIWNADWFKNYGLIKLSYWNGGNKYKQFKYWYNIYINGKLLWIRRKWSNYTFIFSEQFSNKSLKWEFKINKKMKNKVFINFYQFLLFLKSYIIK